MTIKERARQAAIQMYTKDAIEQTNNAIGCLFAYLYNVDPLTIAKQTYGCDDQNTSQAIGHDGAQAYCNGKADEIRSNPVRWYGTLDYNSQRRLATAVVARYADTLVQSVD